MGELLGADGGAEISSSNVMSDGNRDDTVEGSLLGE